MNHPVVVKLVENGVTEITVPGERVLLTQIGGDLTEVQLPGEPAVVTLLSQGFEGDIAGYANAAAASAAAALQSELNAANTDMIEASEDLPGGCLVNVFQDGGPRLRKADATTDERTATGYILEDVLAGDIVRVYFSGNNTKVTGLVPGPQFLSTAPGLATHTRPTSSGNSVQNVGVATRATSLNFLGGLPVTLS